MMNSLYTDGGVINKNPSPIGGTWAWCYTEDDDLVSSDSGIILPKHVHSNAVTNNQSELIAMLKALNSAPKDWVGIVYSDSQVTLGRVFKGWKFKEGIPQYLIDKYKEIKSKFLYWEQIEFVLLAGHPTRMDLEKGFNARKNLPVSQYNVFCDELCGETGRKYLSSL